MVWGASDRSRSASMTKATARRPGGSAWPSRDPGTCASARTRRPLAARSAARDSSSSWLAGSTISGAPSTQAPCPAKLAALHLRAEENGTPSWRAQPRGAGKARPMAASVALPAWSSASAPSAASAGAWSSSRIRLSKAMVPSVRVPVLSRHTTSTRARPSTAGSCCTRTRRRASVTAAAPKAMLVSSTSPCGTMPTSAATVEAAPSPAVWWVCSWLRTSSTATGGIAQVT